MAGGERYSDWSTPALLRAARDTYRRAIRSALVEAGFEDMPRDGAYVVGGMARTGNPMSDVVKAMGVSKQAAGQLVDTLVTRGYLERAVDPEDRRRLTISLTERGLSAAATVRATVDRVDAWLLRRVGRRYLDHTLATLASMIEGDPDHDDPSGPQRGATR